MNSTLPDGREFTKDDLAPLIETYPDLVRQWRLDKEAELVEMIRDACGDSYSFNPDTVLRLATTMFDCKTCEDEEEEVPMLWYPRVLIHNHTTDRPEQLDTGDDMEIVSTYTDLVPWNARERLSFNWDAREKMARVLKKHGFDPNTTTAEEMDALDPIFECIPCNNIYHGRFTMKWTYLVSHCLIFF